MRKPLSLTLTATGSGLDHPTGKIHLVARGSTSIGRITVALKWKSSPGYRHAGGIGRRTYRRHYVSLVWDITVSSIWGKTWLSNGAFVNTYGHYVVTATGYGACGHRFIAKRLLIFNLDPGT